MTYLPPGGDHHLTDEQLSDLLDDLGRPETSAHLASCAECRARLAAWRAAAARVGVSDPVPSDARDRAVLAAVDLGAPVAAPAPLPPPEPADPPPAIPIRRRRLRVMGAVAAGVIVVAGAAVAVGHLGHRAGRSSSASSATTVGTPTTLVGSGGASAASTTISVPSSSGLTAPSLGSIDSLGALENAVTERLHPAAEPSPATPQGATTSAPGASGTPAALPACAASVPAVEGNPHQVPVRFALVYRGTPSVVFVYPGPPQSQLVVESAANCQLEVSASFMHVP